MQRRAKVRGEINSWLVKGGEASDQKWSVSAAKQFNDTAPNRLWQEKGDPGYPYWFGSESTSVAIRVRPGTQWRDQS
jgi:hypothetical protein